MLIRTRLWLNSGVILVVMLTAAIALVGHDRETSANDQKRAMIVNLQKTVFETSLLRDEYVTDGSERARIQWLSRSEDLRNLLNQTRGQFRNSPGRELIEDVQKTLEQKVAIFSQLEEVRLRAGNSGRNRLPFREGEKRLSNQLRLKAYLLIGSVARLRESVMKESAAAQSRLYFLLIVLVGLGVATTIGNSTAVNYLLSKRVAALRQGVTIIGSGDLDHRIQIKGGDELSDLARVSNEMAARLNESYTSVKNLQSEIAERLKVENTLRESEDKFKYVFEYSTIGKSLTLPAGEIQVNKAFCEMLGYSQEELRNRTWQELTHPDDLEVNRRFIDSVLSGENESVRLVKRYLHKNGSIVWADMSAALRRDKEGTPLYLVTSVIDITERKEAEEEVHRLNAELEQRVRDRTAQLEAANKELEAFSYSVSHDLRAPLRGIDGWSQALLEDYGDKLDAQAHKFLFRVRSETQQMGRLIDDLLNLSRLTRTGMQWTEADLEALAQGIAIRLREEYPHRSIDFIIQRGLKAEGDSRLLEVALSNLFGNAVKFTSPRFQARIEFGKNDEGGVRTFFVRDNGVGFDMACAQNLFGAFQRLHKSSEFPGTGIGLATVQRIIHRHGGRIWAEAHPDKGAAFYFTLKEAV
jgi:PAS domain S-box-containing protein